MDASLVVFPANWLAFAGLQARDIPAVPEPAFPPPALRFRALQNLAPERTRVVILGQDPYHGSGEADGLAFSVPQGCRIPPSLRNIFQEMADDLEGERPGSSDLSCWLEQGVLLLNTALSVAPDLPGSHTRLGWKTVTDALLSALGRAGKRRAFILWGKQAQAKAGLLDSGAGHLVLSSPHPSPLSAHRGFWGSRPFSQVNTWLLAQGEAPVHWVCETQKTSVLTTNLTGSPGLSLESKPLICRSDSA